MEPIRRRRVVPPANQGSAPGTNAEPVDASPPAAGDPASSNLGDELDDGWDVAEPATTEPAEALRPTAGASPEVAAPSTAPEPTAIGAEPEPTPDPRRFDVDKTLPSLHDLSPRASGPQADRRRFDVRAPRASRSTRDSQLFRAPEAGAPPARRDERRTAEPRAELARDQRRRDEVEERDLRLPRRPDRSPRLVAESSPADRGGGKRGGEERRPVAARPTPERERAAVPSRKPERSTESGSGRGSTPQVSATASTERAPDPPAPSIEAELRVLGARPVVVKQPKKAGKPRTAREAMREKARALEEAREKAPKTLRSGEVARPAEPSPEPDAASSTPDDEAPRGPRARKAKAAPKHVDRAHETSAEDMEKASPRPGFWSRVKRFFGGS